MSEEAKQKFLANLAKKAEMMSKLSDESKAKIKEMMHDPEMKEKRLAAHNDFFEKADANKDGLLNIDEFLEYCKLWIGRLHSLGIDAPTNVEFQKSSFEVLKISGKDGVTDADLKQGMEWEDELMAAKKE